MVSEQQEVDVKRAAGLSKMLKQTNMLLIC